MSVIKYISKKIDSVLIVSALAKIAFRNFDNLNTGKSDRTPGESDTLGKQMK